MVLSLSPLCIALLFHYRPAVREGLIILGISVTMVVIYLWLFDISHIVKIIRLGLGQLSYISKQSEGLFPNIGLSINEQFSEPLTTTLISIGANWLFLSIITTGIIFLCIEKKKKFLYLLPMTAIGCFSFFFAKRFAIFLTPVCALGFGYFFVVISRFISKKYLLPSFYSLVLIFLVLSSYGALKKQSMPFPGPIVKGMQTIRNTTPQNSLIWSWWDQGHPLVYWADRPTISDGMIHGGARAYYNALPLVTNDFRFAANFMQFYSMHGIAGINDFVKATNLDYDSAFSKLKTILSLGPIKGAKFLESFSLDSATKIRLKNIEFYYPGKSRSIYLFIDKRMVKVFRWIFWLGTWDTTLSEGNPTLPLFRVRSVSFDNNFLPTESEVNIDTNSGLFSIDYVFTDKHPFNSLTTITSNKSFEISRQYGMKKEHPYKLADDIKKNISSDKRFTDTGIYDILLNVPENSAAIVDNKISTSVMFQLFTFKDMKSHDYFEPIDTTSKNYQIWKVVGEHRENEF